ncbi:hypothetical protein PROFUN_09049 [Planoprotostelium fungivorum]|uniref:Uncharacterized protein n=1 Tax=Planoprotostelium fungivorum TaxID=1890364 RepID=A0A2P6MV50_9EUKA|nr:hypothetical protein PROFUN_09049 [Planoprotostelium fungivorum]
MEQLNNTLRKRSSSTRNSIPQPREVQEAQKNLEGLTAQLVSKFVSQSFGYVLFLLAKRLGNQQQKPPHCKYYTDNYQSHIFEWLATAKKVPLPQKPPVWFKTNKSYPEFLQQLQDSCGSKDISDNWEAPHEQPCDQEAQVDKDQLIQSKLHLLMGTDNGSKRHIIWFLAYCQSYKGHLDLPAARRLQDALIILSSLSAGGQRPQFVHLLEYDTINGNPKIGFFLCMPDEKIIQVAGSRVPLLLSIAHFWQYFVKHARPVLMSEDQEAWYRSQDPHLSGEEEKEEQNFVSTYVPEAKYGTGMSIHRSFASYVFLGWQTETGERVEHSLCLSVETQATQEGVLTRLVSDKTARQDKDKTNKPRTLCLVLQFYVSAGPYYCKLINYPNLSIPVTTNLYPIFLASYMILTMLLIKRMKEKSQIKNRKRKHIIYDLEEYLTQYKWIQANPSQNQSYNYKVGGHISVKIDIDVRINSKRHHLE